MNTKLSGVIPPVVTSLHADGSFDKDSYRKLLDRMIDAGVNGLFVLGSTSEVAFSTDERRREIIAAAKEIVAGRVPLIVGCIDTETNRVLEHVKVAVDLGADAVVATAPFYALGGLAEVERHFTILGEKSSVPVFAYDIPVCVHTKLDNDMLIRLGKAGLVAGVKDSSGDDVGFRRLVLANRDAGSPLTLLTGHEIVVDGAYLSGADGSVPGLANVDPEGYVRQWKAYQAGDWEKVREEQDRLTRLMEIAFSVKGVQGFGAGVGSFKTALNLLGVIESNTMPEPVQALEGENREAIAQILRQVGLL